MARSCASGSCEALCYPFGPLFQLLLLTGARLREVRELPKSELGTPNRVWHLPKERAKNSRAYDTHLSDAALAVIDGLPRIAPLPGKPVRLFSMTGEHRVRGYWCPKGRLGQTMGSSDWTLHDLRRTTTKASHSADVADKHAPRLAPLRSALAKLDPASKPSEPQPPLPTGPSVGHRRGNARRVKADAALLDLACSKFPTHPEKPFPP